MKNFTSPRTIVLKKAYTFYTILIVLSVFFNFTLEAQNISPTNGSANCYDCSPPGWVNAAGTPDVADNTTAAVGNVGGGGATWDFPPTDILPLPPNNHTNWISLRDIGTTLENVTATMSNLVVGNSYELIMYWFAPVTNGDGFGTNPGPNDYYAGTFIEDFQYQITGLPLETIVVSVAEQNQWNTIRVPFVATAINMELDLFPGNDSAPRAPGDSRIVYETVQFSLTLDALNTVPVADDNNETTAQDVNVTFNVTSTDTDVDGNIDVATVDLDLSTPGIQNSFPVPGEGTWAVDNMGNITFDPEPDFLGTATTPYTVNDDFTLDGNNLGATSNQATLTVVVIIDNDNDGVDDVTDLDDDNDGILDDEECANSMTNFNGMDGNYSLLFQDGSTIDMQAPDFDAPAWLGLNASPAIFDNAADFAIQDSGGMLPGFNMWYTSAGITALGAAGQPVDFTFPANQVTEYYMHCNSLDQFRITFDDADNPNVGWELMNSNTETNDTAVDPNDFSLGDIDQTDKDANGTDEAADGPNGLSSDFTVRFYPINGVTHLSTLRLMHVEQPGRIIAQEGWQFASEVTWDLDGDGISDCFDTDTDNDGCPDANEAYNDAMADSNGDGTYGGVVGSMDVNPDGTVIGAAYSGTNANVSSATQVSVTTVPTNQTEAPGDPATFTVVVTAVSTTTFNLGVPDYTIPPATDVSATAVYQWQEDGVNLTNGGVYSGVDGKSL